MRSIKDILIQRDGYTADEAQDYINEAKEELGELLKNGELEEAENICETYFGLEPDYIHELL